MIVLGLETSCDETAVGIVDDTRGTRANLVAAQLAEHQPYGGVVPEIAARAHLDHIDGLVRRALDEAEIGFENLSGIAATCGPGLIGGVMVGAMTGKAIAAVRNLPFIAVNHLEAHALTARLTHNVAFPYLLLLVSGGHCQLLLARGVGDYRLLGRTIDDAVGECFDKGAKLLGLGYPGGPAVERAAMRGNPQAFALPLPMAGRDGCDFSFSGLKTALRQLVEAQPSPSPLRGAPPSPAMRERVPSACEAGEGHKTFLADAAASLQTAITAILADRTRNALDILQDENENITALVVAGGVASNQTIRARLSELAAAYALPFIAPPPELCTDNGVMVAWAGLERLRLKLTDGLDFAARPRWALDARS